MQGLYGMMPQLNDFLEQSGMSLPEALVKKGVKENGAKHDVEVIQPLESKDSGANTDTQNTSEK